MKLLGVSVVLVLLAGVWAQINVLQPHCDSPEAEEAALVAQDYLNAQHSHGYKYALSRIEDIRIHTKPDGDTYIMEIDLLETDCHVLDPTPVANCTVRPKILTAVEGDCDVVLKKVGGVLTVTAFKCKTEESTEDLCVGCPSLLPLNDTTALDFVSASLATFNNMTMNETYTLLEVGRISSQIVSGGAIYLAEYVVVEANCTGNSCVPLTDAMATRGICSAKGLAADHIVDCKMFSMLMPIADVNSTAAPALAPAVHVHTGSLSAKHGLRHHKLTAIHDPQLSSFLSAESAESAEVVPVVPAVVEAAPAAAAAAAAVALDAAAPAAAEPAAAADPAAAAPAAAAPAPDAAAPASDSDSTSASDDPQSMELRIFFKREVAAEATPVVAETPAIQADPVPIVPLCPGRVRFF